MFPQQASERLCVGDGACPEPVERVSRRPAHQLWIIDLRSLSQPERASAFTLLELLIVVGIMAILLVLIAPAFTYIKSGTDVTSAAYTIQGVLETARTYAKANNTYTWVGFFEEDDRKHRTNSATLGSGRLVMSIVASKDGTTCGQSEFSIPILTWIDPTRLTQMGKFVKIDNVHFPFFAIGSSTGETFDTRPVLQNDPTAGYNYSRFGELNAAQPNTAPYTQTANAISILVSAVGGFSGASSVSLSKNAAV